MSDYRSTLPTKWICKNNNALRNACGLIQDDCPLRREGFAELMSRKHFLCYWYYERPWKAWIERLNQFIC